VQVGDGGDDRQAQSCAGRAGRAVAAEALEGSLKEFGVEAGAAVEHVQLDRLAVALSAQLDVSRSVTQRVAD
jgi:hypothetical protein